MIIEVMCPVCDCIQDVNVADDAADDAVFDCEECGEMFDSSGNSY